MEVDCEGCAGCCVDWRALADGDVDVERRGRYRPLDDTYRLVVLSRDEVRAFLESGFGDALTPRLFRAESGVEVDGYTLAAIGGRPVFFVGLRKPPKPVAPFDADATWLPTCAFLDPETLQCRIHGDDLYPAECADFPGHELDLGKETECERVEAEMGGVRLLDDDPPDDASPLLLGPQALGAKVFVYPEPADLAGTVERAAAGELTDVDRARFAGAAAAGAPATPDVDRERMAAARETALAADSWIGRAAADWAARAGEERPDPALADDVETARGAPPTPGWN